MAKTEFKTIAQNKKAYHDYFVEETLEAGIELCGTEVKSLQGNIFNRDPMRVRRLLMHKREIMRLFGLSKTVGYSLIPLSVYFKGSRVKVQVGLCKGKKLYDKRSDMAARDAQRDIQRALKEKNR